VCLVRKRDEMLSKPEKKPTKSAGPEAGAGAEGGGTNCGEVSPIRGPQTKEKKERKKKTITQKGS